MCSSKHNRILVLFSHSQVSHRDAIHSCLLRKDLILLWFYHQKSIVPTRTTMTRKRLSRLKVATVAPAPAFGEVTGLGIAPRVPVRVAEVEMKPCSTLVIQSSAGGVCPWSKSKAHLYGKGKLPLFVKTTHNNKYPHLGSYRFLISKAKYQYVAFLSWRRMWNIFLKVLKFAGVMLFSV